MTSKSAENREKLITARTKAGMTQRELAKRLNVSQPYVAAFESGKKSWPEERLLQALGEVAYYAQQPEDDERARWREQIADIIQRYHAQGAA